MENYRLAIIIPAYKLDYLFDTLKSLSEQTDKRFNVYIGDDASPLELHSVVDMFSQKMSIIYKRFSDNLGGKSLVAQWNRCLDLIQDEEFFMMFSDDDIMTPKCVENFYKTIEDGSIYDVYHFDINIIDKNGNIKSACPLYPNVLSAFDFFSKLYRHKKIDARMPEFIFSTKHFRKTGGFVDFDLAYRTDNATVMRCSHRKGIRTIKDSKIYWRESGINVSSASNPNPVVSYKKCNATIEFFNWVDVFLKEINKKWPISIFRRCHIVTKTMLPVYKNTYGGGKKDSMELLKNLYEVKNSKFVFLLYYFTLSIKSVFKRK